MPTPPKPTIPVVVPGRGTVQVAPGRLARVVSVPAEHAPGAGVFRWQAVGDGTFKPCAVIHAHFVKLAEAARIFGVSHDTLRRLCIAGFIACRQPSPRNWQVETGSLSRHLQAVEEDREWWAAERVRRFSEAL